MWNAESMFEVARLLGDALREVKERDGPYMTQNNIDSHANFLVGGQIKGEPPRLFDVYSEGNFIEATPETCYFQIGESKYGKPVLDRVVTRASSLLEATKCTLVSFDSTMRSNISVGLPIDLLVYEANTLSVRAAAADRGVRSLFPDGAQGMGRGAASRVHASFPTRTGSDGDPRRAAASHVLSFRPDGQPFARTRSGCGRLRTAARRCSVTR